MKKVCAWIFILMMLFAAFAEDEPRVYLYFYHSNPCEACHEADNVYRIIEETGAGEGYSLLVVEYREYTSDYTEEMQNIQKWFGLSESPKTPFLIVGNTILSGYDAIRAGLQEAVIEAANTERIYSKENVEKYGSMNTGLFFTENAALYGGILAVVLIVVAIVFAHKRKAKGKKRN